MPTSDFVTETSHAFAVGDRMAMVTLEDGLTLVTTEVQGVRLIFVSTSGIATDNAKSAIGMEQAVRLTTASDWWRGSVWPQWSA